MKRKIFSIASAILVFVATFTACRKEAKTSVDIEGKTFNQQVPMPYLVGDWLKFDTKSQFQQAISLLENGDEQTLLTFESAFQGYKSLRKHLEELSIDENSDLESLISQGTQLYTPDDVFATLLSSKGRIQVGDSIYCYNTSDSSYIVHNNYTQLLLQNSNPQLIPGRIAVHTTFSFVYRRQSYPGTATFDDPGLGNNHLNPGSLLTPGQPESFCKFKPANFLGFGDFESAFYEDKYGNPLPKYNGRDTRILYKLYREYYLIYNVVGNKVSIQNKNRRGRWTDDVRANTLTLQGCGRGTRTSFVCPEEPFNNISYYISKNNKKSVKAEISRWWNVVPFGCLYNIKLYNCNALVTGVYNGAEIKKWFLF